MRHKISGKKLNRTSSHRQALLGTMAAQLLLHEHIRTTLPKAKALRPFAEKMITSGKKGTLSARRSLVAILREGKTLAPATAKDTGERVYRSYKALDPEAYEVGDSLLKKVMETLAVRYKERPGGYTRIVRDGFRKGDNAPMAIIQLV